MSKVCDERVVKTSVKSSQDITVYSQCEKYPKSLPKSPIIEVLWTLEDAIKFQRLFAMTIIVIRHAKRNAPKSTIKHTSN